MVNNESPEEFEEELSEFSTSEEWLPSDLESLTVSEASLATTPEFAAQQGHDFDLRINKTHRWRYHKHQSEVYKIKDCALIEGLIYYRVNWKRTKEDPSTDLWLEYKNLRNCKAAVDAYISYYQSLLKKKFIIVTDITDEVPHFYLKEKTNVKGGGKQNCESFLESSETDVERNHNSRKRSLSFDCSARKRRRIDYNVFS